MIKGIVAAVPRNVVVNTDEAFIKMTGVRHRRISKGFYTSSLAVAAARHLLDRMNPKLHNITALIFVTQTPDVLMPATACKVAGELGLNCAAFDVNLACSGYVYGLWLAHKIGGGGLVLLIAGDTVSRMAPEGDKLFGDAVTATLIDSRSNEGMWPRFEMGTDGAGFDKLIADPAIRMDGTEVMSFAIREVPKLVERVTQNGSHTDWFFFHQANKLIIEHISRKSKLDPLKVPMNIEKYGNCSSASIPLLMCDSAATPALLAKRNNIALFGFGAGWSWSGAIFDIKPLEIAEVIEI